MTTLSETLRHLTPDARVRVILDRLPDSDAVTLDKADVRAILDTWQDAAVAAWWAWHKLEHAKTLPEQADAITELSNHMSDMCTFLPGYDSDLGRLRYDEEEGTDQ